MPPFGRVFRRGSGFCTAARSIRKAPRGSSAWVRSTALSLAERASTPRVSGPSLAVAVENDSRCAGQPSAERLEALHDHSASRRPPLGRDIARRGNLAAEERGRRARHGRGWHVRLYDRPIDRESADPYDGASRASLHDDEHLAGLVQQSRARSAIDPRTERTARALTGRFAIGALVPRETRRRLARASPRPVFTLGGRRLML